MRHIHPRYVLSVTFSFACCAAASAQTAGTAFTYQGELIHNGVPVESACDFEFTLHDAVTGGNQIGGPLSENGVPLSSGVFTVVLDFGGDVFDGDASWLGITVTCPSISAVPIPLSPRQRIRPVPYALALPAMRVEQNVTSPNLIGGFSGNNVTSGVLGATIGGGGTTGGFNRVTDNFGTVAGGQGNQAGNDAGSTGDANVTTVGGGVNNIASGNISTVSGGSFNTASGTAATVPGGTFNAAGGEFSFAAGFRAKVRNAAQVGGVDVDGDEGTFVWADSTDANFQSTGPDQFLIRASGGVGIGTTAPDADLHVSGTGSVQLLLEADTNASGQDDHPTILMTQLAGLVVGGLGFSGNDLSLGVASLSGDNDILLETFGNVGIGTSDPTTKLNVRDRVLGFDSCFIGCPPPEVSEHVALLEHTFAGDVDCIPIGGCDLVGVLLPRN